MIGQEDQPPGMDEIDGNLAFPVLFQFVAIGLMEMPHVFQRDGRFQLGQPLLQATRIALPELGLHFHRGIAELLHLPRTEAYFHHRPLACSSLPLR
ncbi:MAG: hypothetical protein ACKV0T_31725 [Planctomycetales bacterium]